MGSDVETSVFGTLNDALVNDLQRCEQFYTVNCPSLLSLLLLAANNIAAATKQLPLAANSCCWQLTVAACSQQLLLAANSWCWQLAVSAFSQQLLLAASS